jgi:hypothetical protein
MLLFKSQDVLYSLEVAAHMKAQDKKLQKNENVLNIETKKTQAKKKKPINEVV